MGAAHTDIDMTRVPADRTSGELISRALARVGRQGVVTMEESRTAEDQI